MKFKLILLFILVLLVTGCTNKDYDGYWCSYKEDVSLVVLLEHDVKEADITKLENLIESFEDLNNYDILLRKDLANDGINIDNVYDTYFVYLNSSKNINEYIDNINSISGIYDIQKENNKNDMKLYKLENGKFEFRTSLYDDSISGKYKIKGNEITFNKGDVSKLYIKDDFLCADSNCNKILIRTDQLCESINN